MLLPKQINPFFLALVPVGILFAITACAYSVMMARGQGATGPAPDGLLRLLDQRGMAILVTELALLAVLTVAAIGTDEFWSRRIERRDSGRTNTSDQP